MKGRNSIVKDIRSVYVNLTPFRALRTCNKVPLAVDLFSVLKALNNVKLSMFQFFVLHSIYEFNLSLIPARPRAFTILADKRQVSECFTQLKKRGLISPVPFNPMLTHTVERTSKCYEVTEQGKKLINSYTYLVKDTQKQAKNARLKFIDGN
jgi:DNA-binding MarR family transcriptional regulator